MFYDRSITTHLLSIDSVWTIGFKSAIDAEYVFMFHPNPVTNVA